MWDLSVREDPVRGGAHTKPLHYPLGSYDVLVEAEGITCLLPPVVRKRTLEESALLFCRFGDSDNVFSAEVQVDPQNDMPSERMQEFVFRRGALKPVRLLVACN